MARWNALTGDPVGSLLRDTPGDPMATYAGDYGAEVFSGCVACTPYRRRRYSALD